MSSAVHTTARVYFHTLGCPKNDADSRALGRRLATAGARIVGEPTDATHIVVNTCGFIQDAKEESIEAILSILADNQDKRVLVMGCLVERYREELAKGIPEVSDWFGVIGDDMGGQLLGAISGATQASKATTTASAVGAQSYAYLKISDGCDEGCTFCAIPDFKGGYESVPTAEILREADACVGEGARELVLVGQETTRWQSDGLDLQGLIDLLGEDERVKRIRVMYLQPTRLTESFLEFMAGNSKLCRYLDVPFQHSHEQMLRKMGRRGDAKSYAALLKRARALMPDVALRSTFIVGFPGEGQQHFEALMDFVTHARFDYGGAFIYSPEEGTEAATLRPLVRPGVARKRLNLLTEAILEIGASERGRLLETELEVMIDTIGEDEMVDGCCAIGRTCGQAPEVDGVTYLRGTVRPDLRPGDVVRVKISEIIGCDMVGDVCAS
jgi:ribosomal protein S12 methylthiotransferase